MIDSQSVMTGVRDAELDSGHWVRVRLWLRLGAHTSFEYLNLFNQPT